MKANDPFSQRSHTDTRTPGGSPSCPGQGGKRVESLLFATLFSPPVPPSPPLPPRAGTQTSEEPNRGVPIQVDRNCPTLTGLVHGSPESPNPDWARPWLPGIAQGWPASPRVHRNRRGCEVRPPPPNSQGLATSGPLPRFPSPAPPATSVLTTNPTTTNATISYATQATKSESGRRWGPDANHNSGDGVWMQTRTQAMRSGCKPNLRR